MAQNCTLTLVKTSGKEHLLSARFSAVRRDKTYNFGTLCGSLSVSGSQVFNFWSSDHL